MVVLARLLVDASTVVLSSVVVLAKLLFDASTGVISSVVALSRLCLEGVLNIDKSDTDALL